jgi:DNA-binding NarL/FixJ family response regulator
MDVDPGWMLDNPQEGSSMSPSFTSSSREQNATSNLLEALGSSLDIRLVLERAYPFLRQLVPADYGALGVSSTGRPEDYEWTVANMPPSFFAAYPEMAPHDFVRTSVTQELNVVLRDEEMVSRTELEASMMYRRAREIGAPLEQVMAVMLHVDERWQSGLSLFREKRRPFSERERAALQRVTPAMANAVRNCHMFSAAVDWGTALETVLQDRGASIVLVAPPALEIKRTAGAARIIAKWFAPHEWRAGCLPEPLAAVLAQVATRPLSLGAPAKWAKRSADATLQISFVSLAGSSSKASWMLTLQEVPDAVPLPRAWQKLLTPREQEVISAAARGWDNVVISHELGCAEATVKKHMSNSFTKLGVESRAALLSLLAKLLRDE